jgi:hypothetical protein
MSEDLDDSGSGWSTDADQDGVPDAVERIAVVAAAAIAAIVARKGAAALWRATTGRRPPDVLDGDGAASIGTVLLWGAAVGAAVGAARVLAERQARAFARSRRAA